MHTTLLFNPQHTRMHLHPRAGTPQTTQQMIRIHQENGAVVGVLGSSFHTHMADTFAQGDLSVAVDFMEFARETHPTDTSEAALRVQRAILSFTQVCVWGGA